MIFRGAISLYNTVQLLQQNLSAIAVQLTPRLSRGVWNFLEINLSAKFKLKETNFVGTNTAASSKIVPVVWYRLSNWGQKFRRANIPANIPSPATWGTHREVPAKSGRKTGAKDQISSKDKVISAASTCWTDTARLHAKLKMRANTRPHLFSV